MENQLNLNDLNTGFLNSNGTKFINIGKKQFKQKEDEHFTKCSNENNIGRKNQWMSNELFFGNGLQNIDEILTEFVLGHSIISNLYLDMTNFFSSLTLLAHLWMGYSALNCFFFFVFSINIGEKPSFITLSALPVIVLSYLTIFVVGQMADEVHIELSILV